MATQLYNIHPSTQVAASAEWKAEARQWEELNRGIGGNSDFDPLAIKGFYVIGVILTNCRSVNILLSGDHLISTVFYPSYAVFASAVELLGRCIRGNKLSSGNTEDLRTGFKWLKAPTLNMYQAVDKSDLLVSTSRDYPIEELTQLRHFTAHGQAIKHSIVRSFDYLILGQMPPLIGSGIESYLRELRTSSTLADSLARASVSPYRDRPIFEGIWDAPLYDADLYPASIGNKFRQMDWTYKDNLRFGLGSYAPKWNWDI